jgi:tetratricopeptide (TPR) repeat protein
MEEARDAMKRSISAPKSPLSVGGFTAYFLGMTELHLGRVDEAKKILGTLHPSAETKTISGFVAAAHALCGHVDEEREWISRVEQGRTDPETAVADWYRLGCVWFVAGNRPRAAECVSRCLELQPEFGPALRLREQLLNGNAERVKSARSEAAASRGNIPSAVQRLSAELSDMPMGPSWMALAQEGMGYVAKLPAPLRMPREAQQHFLRAQAILKNATRPGEIREALGEYRWALRYAPLTPEIHLHLSSVYATQKQFSQALRHIETCLAGFEPSEKLDAIIGRYYELQYLEERAQRNIRAIRPGTGAP